MSISDYISPDTNIMCPRCKNKTMTMAEWPGPCKVCKKDSKYKKEQTNKVKELEKKIPAFGGIGYRNLPDVVGIFKDNKTGQDVAVDTKGRKHKIEDTHYDIKKDPHGWKSSGMKVSETDSKGRPNR